jgi:hypothetical protein
MLAQGILRPSNLPKLKLCAWYRNSDGEPSEAAGRGTRIDTVYREILTGLKDFPDGSAAEIAAADWAACQTSRIAGDHPILVRKEECGVTIPGFPAPGEVDAICLKLFTSFDLKSGQQYDYQLPDGRIRLGVDGEVFRRSLDGLRFVLRSPPGVQVRVQLRGS